MKKKYLKPYMVEVPAIQHGMLCLSVNDGPADGSDALVHQRDGYFDFSYSEENEKHENLWIYEE